MKQEVNVLLEANANSVRRSIEITPWLAAWFKGEMDRIHSTIPTATGGMLMGGPVWGEKYLDRMLRFGIPSLMSERNLAILSGKKHGNAPAVLVLYILAEDKDPVFKATRPLRQAGIMTALRDIPKEVMNAMGGHKDDKYGILACVQNLLVHEAGWHAMGIHMWMPDHHYCDGYFEELAKRTGKYPAIIQQSMSVNIETAEKDVEYWRQAGDGAIAMPPDAMGKLILDHMHERSHRHVMNYGGSIPDAMPDSRQVIWKGKEHFHILDGCQLIAWLCPELCQDAPISFTSTMDMLHPDYIPPGQFYMVEPDDGMMFCELTGNDRMGPPGYVSTERFLMRWWQQVAFTDDYMQYTKQLCRIKIPEQAEGDYFSDEHIEGEHRAILEMVQRNKSAAMEVYFRSQVPSRWPDEMVEKERLERLELEALARAKSTPFQRIRQEAADD
jgi:hypothetical protein